MLECFVTMNWLIVSLMVLLFPRNGNLNVIKDELPSKNFDLNELPFESISDVSNRQWYGSRHFLFGVLQGRVPTSMSSTLKPVTGFTTNLPTSLRNLNDERVLKKRLSRKNFDLNAAKKLPGVLLSDVSSRQLYGGRHLLFGVLQENLQASETSTLKPVARFVTNLPTSLGYLNDKSIFKNNKISNRKNLSVNKTFNPVSNATNLLHSSLSNTKSSSSEHNNIQFANDNSRPLTILAPQRVEASENAKETGRMNISTTENSEIRYNLKAEDLQNRLNSKFSTTTDGTLVNSQNFFKMIASNSNSPEQMTTNFETSVSSDNTSTHVVIQNSTMVTDLFTLYTTQNNTMTTDLDTSVSSSNTITSNTTQYSTMTTDFKTSASTHSSSIHVTTDNSTMTPTKCPCTDQPGLVAGIVVAVMCFIVILFTGTFFLIKRRWRNDPESQPLLR